MEASSDRGQVFRLGQPWQGAPPFLFANWHVDHYPAGNEDMTPATGLDGRPLGSDFGHPSGWNMYHGQSVPGFPAHPHRGFETITILSGGYVDHADSTGAAARFGPGDVQWLTAGRGISHSEMFPLLETDADNPFELFQIWLNLPAASKMVEPEFRMLWNEDIPVVRVAGPGGGEARVKVIAGRYLTEQGDAVDPLAPPVGSWAADPASDVAVWLLELDPHARVELPAQSADQAQRVLYVYGDGSHATVAGRGVEAGFGFAQAGPGTTLIETGASGAKLLLLQGVPIDEPVAQHGPFVMNTRDELIEAYDEYQRTRFGGWPWGRDDVVHPRTEGRFARHTDGRLERPGATAR
ncbi:pirin family protein [Rhodococcus tukisamuensis]|uniref:Pirin n=1 Tax=Rhodococcus tukisamuensis TaxID=168276 RepID=A0A1G6R883_9NOCA|nr:pirin family protein [Rhodococcus tukisamuensis]SDD00247.1 hypothetical protein SAMN05444580_102355 [Rhodococcus tukisamuensis]